MQELIPDVMNELDYSSTMTVTFAPGEDEKWVTFRLKDDARSEGSESFSLLLANAVGVEVYEVTSLSVRISDDEPTVHSTISFSKARYDSEDGVATLLVERTGAEYSLVDMRIFTSEDTAKADEDYESMDAVLTFLPYETEKEVEIYVGGEGSFSVILDDFTACQGGQYTRTKVHISEEDSGPRLRASGPSFTIKIDGKNYTVEYTKGQPTGKILDPAYDIPPEVGTYYFALPDDSSHNGYFSYDENQRSGSKPWGCGTLDCAYVEKDNQHESYGDVAYYHTTTTKKGEVWTTTNDRPVPAAYYQFLAPDWESTKDVHGGQEFRFKATGLGIEKIAKGKFSRSLSTNGTINSVLKLENIQSTTYNAPTDLYASAIDNNGNRTPKSYLRFYGVAAMYKRYNVSITDPDQVDFRTGNLDSNNHALTVKETPVQVQVKCGAQSPIGSGYTRDVYANTDDSKSSLVFSLSDASIGGSKDIYGVITGYTITIDPGSSEDQVKAQYPAGFIKFLNEKKGKGGSNAVADYTSSAVEAEIKKINNKLNTIPIDVYFVDWIDSLQKAVIDSGSGYYQKLNFKPIVDYVDVKVQVLAPAIASEGVKASFLSKDVNTTGTKTFHAGDILNLSAMCSDPNYTVLGYEVSTNGGVNYNSITDTDRLQLQPNKSYTIRPLVVHNANRIEIQFTDSAQNYITVRGVSGQGTVSVGKLPSGEDLTGRTILNLNPLGSGDSNKMVPTVGKVYPILFSGKVDGDYTYRPVITDTMTGQVYKTNLLYFAARGSQTDNVLKIGYEKVLTDELAACEVSGKLVSNYYPVRNDGLAVKKLPVSGYTVTASKGGEVIQNGTTLADTVNMTTGDDGVYTLPGIKGKTGDRITLLAGNGADEQILEVVLGSASTAGANEKAISYPTTAPKVSSLSYYYDKSANNDITDNTQVSVKMMDDALNITTQINNQGANVDRVIFKLYNPALGLVSTHDSGNQPANAKITVEVGNGSATLKIPKMLENLHNGDYITVSLVEKRTGSDGTVYDIIYPEVDLGLIFYIENLLLIPKTYEVPETTPIDLPIVGSTSASSSSGLLSFSRTNRSDGKGYTLTINADILFNTTTPGTEDKLAKLNALNKAAAQTQANLDKLGSDEEMDAALKSFDDSYLGLVSQFANDEITQEEYELLSSSLDEQKKATAKMQAGLEDEAKAPLNSFTKSKKMRFDALFLMAFEFLYNEVTMEYEFVCGSVAIGGTFSYVQSIYSTIYGVPVFVNFTGSVQGDLVVSFQSNKAQAAMTAGEFDNYSGNLAKRLSNTMATFGMTLSLKAQAGVGMCGVLAARGYMSYSMQFSIPLDQAASQGGEMDAETFKKLSGVLLMASGGIGLDLLLLSVDLDIGNVRYGAGKFKNMTGVSFINGTIPVASSLRSAHSASAEDTETIAAQAYSAGTADLSSFGAVPSLRTGGRSGPMEVSRTTLLDDAATRTRPQLVELSNGSKMLFFIGNRSEVGELNNMALYYSICKDGVWSTPEMVADDGTADTNPTVLQKNGKVVVAWADADRPYTEDDTNMDKLNALGISMAIYEDGQMGKELTLVEDEFFNFAPQLNLVDDTLYCSYMKRDISNVKTEEGLLDYTNTYSTMAYVACDVPSRTAGDEQFIVIKHPVLTDPLVMDYQCITTEVDSVNYMLATYTVDEDGDLTTSDDRELFLAIKDLDSNKDFYPIALTRDQLNQALPKLSELNGTVYLTWLESSSVFSLLDVSDLLESIFAPGSIEVSNAEDDTLTTINLTSAADEYLASARRGDADWFRKSAEELGLDDEIYEGSIYERLAKDSVQSMQADFEGSISTSISNYLLTTNGDDIYIFYTAGTPDENETGVELFGVRYQQDSDDEDENDEAWGFGQSVQVSSYGKVIDEITLIMNEDNDISVVSNFYDQWIGSDGNMHYGANQLVELEFQPRGSLSIVDDSIDLPGRLIAGMVDEISFQVENEGLLTATGFDVTVTQFSGGTGTVIYEESIDTELNSGDVYEVKVPWIVPADIPDTSIFVEVNEHDVASNPAQASVTVPYSSNLEITDINTVWTGTEGVVTATVTNTGNKAATASEATLTIFDTDDKGKIYASASVPALTSGESHELTIPFSPAVEDFEALGYIDLELKVKNGELDTEGYSRLLVNTPVMAEINGGDETITLKAGRTAKATTAVGPWAELAGEAIYIVDDPTVATVDSNGTVHGVSVGTTTLRASYAACSASDTITITVTGEGHTPDDDDDSASGGPSVPAIRDDVTVEEKEPAVSLFTDVDSSAYYADAVKWAVENDITSGTSATTFGPDAACTRAQAVTFLWRNAGSPKAESNVMPFTDVAADAYYYDAVLWAVEQGITTGTTETTFSPNAYCTRAQIVTFIYRNVQANGGGFQDAWAFRLPFTDTPEWAYESIAWCYMKGITAGTSETTFSPDAKCTRAQIVTFLWRGMN